MDQSPPRTLLEQLVRASRQTIDENCAAFEHTAHLHGENATLSPRQLWRWIAGEVGTARPVAQRVAELHWGLAFGLLIGPPRPVSEFLTRSQHLPEVGSPDEVPPDAGLSLVAQVELLRQGLHDAIGTGSLTQASLDEWEQTVLRHGQATRYRPPGVLLLELAADFAELKRTLARRQTSSALRRLTRTTAQLAGLMFLTLIKLNVPVAARNWARTARIAADEAGDPAVCSWVRAQEAYVHYYAGSLVETITTARRAQTLAGHTPCVGVPLAAAIEARTLAALGEDRLSREAIGRAERALAQLAPDDLVPSAFGYNEAQLRFHEGNALTHLHATQAAYVAQDRALALYPKGDYLDRALLQLDRAQCLASDGDAVAGVAHATRTVEQLPNDERTGIVVLRAEQVLESLTPPQRALPGARNFQDLLLSTPAERDQP